MHGEEAREHGPIVGGFRHRGHRHVGRIESFSDAVFGFSVTLLVVSLEVPKTFDDLLRTLAGFPAFALTFALLVQIWYLQYRFFRRYGMHDLTTIVLNLVLLFVVVFFTYPLKFLFANAFGDGSLIRHDQWTGTYAVYGFGYAAVFAVFLALYAHAMRNRRTLKLTALEAFYTRRAMIVSAIQIGIAALSIGVAALFTWLHDYAAAARFGGLVYLLVPVGIRIVTRLTDPKRRLLEARAGV